MLPSAVKRKVRLTVVAGTACFAVSSVHCITLATSTYCRLLCAPDDDKHQEHIAN